MTEVGFAALSDEVRIIVPTPAARHASMTFCVPTTFVWVASNGLYSPDSTCLSAAQWKTVSMPSIARTSRSRSRMSPMRKRTSRSVAQPLALVELLRLVAAEDADDLGLGAEELVDQAGADGPGAAGDEDAPAAEGCAGGDRKPPGGSPRARLAGRGQSTIPARPAACCRRHPFTIRTASPHDLPSQARRPRPSLPAIRNRRNLYMNIGFGDRRRRRRRSSSSPSA